MNIFAHIKVRTSDAPVTSIEGPGAYYSTNRTLEVDNYNATACIEALARSAKYTEPEIEWLMRYIKKSGSIGIRHVEGWWNKKQTELLVRHRFTPDVRTIYGRDLNLGKYGMEEIQFTPLPDTMKEIMALDKQDAEAILSL